MNFINYKNKNVHWWNKNYYWIVTIIYIILNVTIYYVYKGTNILWEWTEIRWENYNGIKDLLISFGNLYTHNDWKHVICNMIAFFIGGFYLERKVGSINFLLLLQIMSIFSSSLTSMYVSFFWAGSSVLYYGVWGYVVIDYLFTLKEKDKTNNILGFFTLICIYVGCCVSNNIIDTTLEPIHLLYNAGHYYGFIVGILISLIINITKIQERNN